MSGGRDTDAPRETPLPCGHPVSAVVAGGEGTSFCGLCAGENTDTAAVREALSTCWPSHSHLRREAIAALARLEARLTATERERDEARAHVGAMPSVERIRDAHSRLPAEWRGFQTDRHDPYHSGEAEGCYICALLGMLGAAEARLTDRSPVGIVVNGRDYVPLWRFEEIEARLTDLEHGETFWLDRYHDVLARLSGYEQALADVSVHVAAARRATPVRDETRDAHFELEHACQALALARAVLSGSTRESEQATGEKQDGGHGSAVSSSGDGA